MRIRDIYERYQVPPWLQLHQVRVAAVGKIVAEAQKESVDTNLVVSTCLLHDVGAIVKFDLAGDSYGFYTPSELGHWIAVQTDIRSRFGIEEYAATSAILEELGLNRVHALFAKLGSKRLTTIISEGLREVQIVQYGDTRVGPHSILSLNDRITEARARYAPHANKLPWFDSTDTHRTLSSQLETILLGGTTLDPVAINDITVAPVIKELWDYDIA